MLGTFDLHYCSEQALLIRSMMWIMIRHTISHILQEYMEYQCCSLGRAVQGEAFPGSKTGAGRVGSNWLATIKRSGFYVN